MMILLPCRPFHTPSATIFPTVTIETCQSPVSALLRLQGESFAVVLSDFNMPGMNGLRLLRAARESGSDASFIVMTGDGTDDILTEGLRLGMFALVGKPLNRAALIPLIQQAIECHRLRQEVAELRRTITESGLELGSLMPGVVSETEEVLQPPLPY
jgi:DNA-binding NtrC family response regulator